MFDLRKYKQHESAVFRKTTAQWGGLSNMAKGYPLKVNKTEIQSSEILYQAMRFTGHPEVQAEILSQKNPMRAKFIARENISLTRQEWDKERIKFMKWVTSLKLCQNWDTFSSLLLSTEGKVIVEYSSNDTFWGAKKIDYNTYSGTNALGRILMFFREACQQYGQEAFRFVPPLSLNDFYLLGEPIQNAYPFNKVKEQITMVLK